MLPRSLHKHSPTLSQTLEAFPSALSQPPEFSHVTLKSCVLPNPSYVATCMLTFGAHHVPIQPICIFSECVPEFAPEFSPVFLSLLQPELTISSEFAPVLSSLAVLKNIDGKLHCSMFFVGFSNRDSENLFRLPCAPKCKSDVFSNSTKVLKPYSFLPTLFFIQNNSSCTYQSEVASHHATLSKRTSHASHPSR